VSCPPSICPPTRWPAATVVVSPVNRTPISQPVTLRQLRGDADVRRRGVRRRSDRPRPSRH
jgi:hypothetical protein